MYHMYTSAKGDSLCPLGFHPQVRWPTRCKRCFRDYKEHVGKKIDRESNLHKDASTLSTPSLSSNPRNDKIVKRSWVSTTNLTPEENPHIEEVFSPPSSWISTPDLANIRDDTQPITTVNMRLPKKIIKSLDTGQDKDFPSTIGIKDELFSGTGNSATRAKKSSSSGRRIQVKEVKTMSEEPTSHDVQFLIQVKAKPRRENSQENLAVDDTISVTDTETTDTTLVDTDENDLRCQLESLKNELDITKMKCSRLEREKSDILLRRLAAMETTTSKTAASEVLKLQQKCNEMQHQLEDYSDEKKSLMLKVKELEEDLELRTTNKQERNVADDLQSKLLATETLCEELMDENEDIKKELRDLEIQMDELQDNFREDQAIEYTSVKKELDQTTKNCRILSFKLRKSERKLAQTELEKSELEKRLKEISERKTALNTKEKIKGSEQNLKSRNEVSLKSEKGLDETTGKSPKSEKSEESKVSRATLTKGGSQDDPAQLLRDLQDSLEREADLKEQLKFAEEEAQTLHKKVSRIEDDNESLVLQLKKMAVRARTRKLSPTNQNLLSESQDKGEVNGNDNTEIKLQLELSEQEASILRNKVEELESENRDLKTEVKKILERSATKTTTKRSLLGSEKIRENSLLGQNIKVLDAKTNNVRKKRIERESSDTLNAEVGVTNKSAKGIPRNKDILSLDLNEKLTTENLKGDKGVRTEKNFEKYIDRIATLENELAEKNKVIKELKEHKNVKNENCEFKDDSIDYDRSPKKITSLMSKAQMRAIIEDLEKEISKLLIIIKTDENIKKQLGEEFNLKVKKTMEDFEMLNEKCTSTQKELEEERLKHRKMIEINEEVKKDLNGMVESLNNSSTEKSLLQMEIKKLNEENENLFREKSILDGSISELQDKLRLLASKDNEINSLYQKCNSLRASFSEREKEIQELKRTQTDITSESLEKDKKILKLKSQITILENSSKQQESVLQERNKALEAEVDQKMQLISSMKSAQAKWEESEKKSKNLINDLSAKIKNLEENIEQKEKSVRQLETTLAKERKTFSKTNMTTRKVENEEVIRLKDELSKTKQQMSDLESRLVFANDSCGTLEKKLTKSQMESKSIKLENQRQIKQLEIDLQNERQKLSVIKANSEKEQMDKELELKILRENIQKLEEETKKTSDMKQIPSFNSDSESTMTKERQNYQKLTAKYEILEEEHVITKAKLVVEKESLELQNKHLKLAMKQVEEELETTRNNYYKEQEVWIKEKLEWEGKLKEFALQSNGCDTNDRQRLKSLLEEQKLESNRMKKQYNALHDQMNFMRRENDDLKKKLDDYEKVNRIQRNISADNSAMEQEMKQLRKRLENAEKNRKAEVAELKIRHESQMNVVNVELQSLQNQLFRFKREKDTYRHMLETAQKTIGTLNQMPKTIGTGIEYSTHEELKEYKSKVAALEEQISCMEDEFSEAKLECSRLKTELISERSSWEVKISELHSKVNELEEEKVLSSGRTKIVGLRTKMELAWQKEREEQQRLLQETATLARDLRQTLFEVERERDKERLEAKRKLDQLKKASEEEQGQNKKKVTELQNDLFELGNAHAKLRTTNEILRREKKTSDTERERSTSNYGKPNDQEEVRRINELVEQLDNLKQLAPDLFFSTKEVCYTPNPPRRTKSKSRESSPAFREREISVAPEEKQQQIQYLMQRLVRTTEDLRRGLSEDAANKIRMRKAMGMRRASSLEHDNGSVSTYDQPYQRKEAMSMRGTLSRKSLSLEQTTKTRQSIWINDKERSSMNSLESHSDIERGRMKRDTSMDSTLSSGSTQSELGDKKKKKGIIGKLKKLTKSRSIDDQDPGTFSPTRSLSPKVNSHGDSKEENVGSKKDLKEKFVGIFRISGSGSTSSGERRQETSSTQRPLIRNRSNGQLTQTSREK